VVPVTVAGAALTAVPTDGALLITVTKLKPVTVPLVAMTVPLAEMFGAVNRPLVGSIVPTELDHVIGAVIVAPNWSVIVAVNCWV
jgi:hypothetical protein